MKKTFVCDDSMIITIPIGSLNGARVGQVMPEKFHCVFRDGYKVFVLKGKPKPLGVAQAIAGVLVVVLGLVLLRPGFPNTFPIFPFTSPSAVYVVCGVLTYAAGHFPNMHLAKVSFAMNILGLLWSITIVIMFGIVVAFRSYHTPSSESGILGLILTLQAFQMFSACFLIHWQSKAVCKDHFNTLPIVLLKQAD